MKQLSALFSFALLALFLALPVQAQTARFGAPQVQDGFGRAVAVQNGTVFVGESRNVHAPGRVYVYEKSDGEWVERAQLSASDGTVGDQFGDALVVSGTRLLVGASAQDEERGAAYLFEQSDDGNWTEVARLAPPDTVADSGFGRSVALDDDVALVGASAHRDNAGAVYVFRRDDAGTWTRQAELAGSDIGADDRFGAALALDGDQALISAPRQNGGTVYVFQRDDAGTWTEETQLTANRLGNQAAFGATLSFADDLVLIGAPRHDGGLGTVLTFERDADTGEWTQAGRLAAFDGQERSLFGASLAFDGREAWVGAPGAADGTGALYRFEWDDATDTWLRAEKVAGAEVKEDDRFAGTVALAGDVAVVGSVGADFGAGTATIFERDDASTWTAQATVVGSTDTGLQAVVGERVDCADGQADVFDCEGVDLVSFLPIHEIGGERGVQVNDIWGWTDPETGNEYAIVGRMDGTSFVDVSDPLNPVYVGDLPKHEGSQPNIWRDIKVYENHAYVVADNAGEHGMQVFDLTQLRDFEGEPLTFEETAHYDRVNSAHNVVINEDTGFAYIVGSSGGGETCGGGLHMVNIQNPTEPEFAGCFADPSTGRSGTGYTHDAQCVVYDGPDTEHQGKEICIGANETAISIADVSDKDNPIALSTASYPDHAYVHQGWLTEDHRYFFQNDELDELNGSVDSTRTLVWDLADLDDPQLVREFFLSNPASDHNLYIKDGTMYQSNYVSGLRVLDVNDPENPVEVGHFDTLPFGEDAPGFAGTWSNYPYFESGIIVVASMQEGLFILRTQKRDV